MSSRSKRRDRNGRRVDSRYPTQWSEWEWLDSRQTYGRYRLKAPNDYEYEYGPAQRDSTGSERKKDSDTQQTVDNDFASETTTRVNCTWPSCNISFPDADQRDRHYVTVHSNNGERPFKCFVVDCPAGVTSWATADKLRTHNKSWHGPYHCRYLGCSRGVPNGFASQDELDAHIEKVHAGEPGWPSSGNNTYQGPSSTGSTGYSFASYGSIPPKIGPDFRSPRPTSTGASIGVGPTDLPDMSTLSMSSPSKHIRAEQPSRATPQDRHYKVCPSWQFKPGKVFKVLWTEPTGSQNNSGYETEVSETDTSSSRNEFQKVRRFVILRSLPGHSICLPINTYGGQGVNKIGVHAKHHAIIYSTPSPKALAGEVERGLRLNSSIRFEPSSSRHHLESASRINYAKIYTIEHNVKVWFIGQIHADSVWFLSTDFEKINPPLQPMGVPPRAAASYGTRASNEETKISNVSSNYGSQGDFTPQSPRYEPSFIERPYSTKPQEYPRTRPASGYAFDDSSTNRSYSPYSTFTMDGYTRQAGFTTGTSVPSSSLSSQYTPTTPTQTNTHHYSPYTAPAAPTTNFDTNTRHYGSYNQPYDEEQDEIGSRGYEENIYDAD